MIDEIFDINKFNILSDEDNYYFFRALNKRDMSDIENKLIVDDSGKIVRIRTDREFYGETIFKKDEPLTLEQIIEHIKIDYNKHTNCISFSSNANVALDYGRSFYDNKYIVLRVPKSEFGKKIVNSGQYILQEINKVLKNYYETLDDEMTKYFFDAIDNAKTEEQLNNIKSMLTKDYIDESKNIFVNGIEQLMSSQDSNALNSQQNLLKNKIILKMDLMKEPIIDRIGNKFLINTLGNAFSSVELTHYNDVEGNIIAVSPEIMDIISLLQQVPETKEIAQLKRILIEKINNGKLNIPNFELEKYDVKRFENSLTLENIYNLTKGNIEYKSAKNIYLKSYILAKSRLRKEKSLDLLKSILNDNKYDDVIEYLRNNTYGIEAEIVNRKSNKDAIKLSESVSLTISNLEKDILKYINSLSIQQIENILENPFIELQNFIEDNYTNEYITETWLANSIIDLIDWPYYGVEEHLSLDQRELLIENLKSHNFIDIYNNLNKQNLSDQTIANAIMLILIRNTTQIDINEKFTLSELEEFLGCNQIKDTKINLKSYQREAFTNINKNFNEKDYTSVILPTGTGKSYVALSEMHYFEEKINQLEETKHAKILYLAPNNYILDQLKRIISKNYRTSITENNEDIVRKTFPNLTLATYSYLTKGNNADDIINGDYDLIVLDELHRTGANEWGKQLNELLKHQKAKVLGITATPERDMDKRDMSEELAKNYGYTDDDILEEKHLSYNMNLLEAIQRGIIHNPNVINCEYALSKDGSLDELELKIEDITDENLKSEKRKEYENLRREVESSNGIEQILKDNLKSDGKYIVFIPITKNNDGKYINTESNEVITDSQAQRIIKSYQDLMQQFLFSGEYLETNKDRLTAIYDKINNNINLDESEINYLNNEKNNILLLTSLHIDNRPSALQSLINDMASKIIEYMNWETLIDSKIISIINAKMKHKVESYNMISDNSKGQNDKNLADFNSSQSPKMKFMFVMDMLNEGVHVNKIDGIIWFRALNENSKILFLQQLGRCISAIGEDNKDNIPTVIDLVNNTLKVDILKGVKKEQRDLSKLIEIAEWIDRNGIPNPNSTNKEIVRYYKILRRIQTEYGVFLDNKKLEEQKVERKLIIKKIIKVGSEFDLWNYEFTKSTSTTNSNTSNNDIDNEKDDLLAIFGIKGKLRLFSDLYEDVSKLDKFLPEDYVKLISKYCSSYNEWPKHLDTREVQLISGISKTGVQLARWLDNSGYNRDNFKYDESLKNILDDLKEKYYKEAVTPEDYVELIKDYCIQYNEWPKYAGMKEIQLTSGISKTGGQLALWLQGSGYNRNDFKYAKSLKSTLDGLKEKYYEKVVTPEDYVELIKNYCIQYNEWPKQHDTKEVHLDSGISKTSNQLTMWLRNTSGYNKGNFKYGESLKNILDDLKEKYYGIVITPENYVELIHKYCIQYNEWPKYDTKEIQLDSGISKTSNQLTRWLNNTSGYSKGNFKYDETLKNILDDLKEKYYKEAVTPEDYVTLIKDYCIQYNEWPKYDGTKEIQLTSGISKTGGQLALWLQGSGYNRNDFKYDKSLKSTLDDLKEKYYEIVITPENYVELIHKYCIQYNEWPKQRDTKEVHLDSGISKTSNQLAMWLDNYGYNRNDFKYDETLKNILDDLKEKYYKAAVTPEDYVTLIRNYCIQYNEWPKKYDAKEIQLDSDISKTSNQLAMWLNNTSGYSKGNFKYDETLKNILDDLKEKYYEKVATPEDYVTLIRDYCIQYNEWPKNDGTKEIQLTSGISKTSNQLAVWLQKSGYNRNDFKYDKSLKSTLDDLKEKYYGIVITPENYVELIHKYCIQYNEWPKQRDTKEVHLDSGISKTSNQLAVWLKTSGYNRNGFKYDEALKNILDDLQKQYYRAKNNYDNIDQITSADSHFQKVVHSRENSMEDKSGRKLH